MHTPISPFYIRKKRTVPGIIKDSFHYMAENANAMLICMGIMALPFILISVYVASLMTDNSNPFDSPLYYKKTLDLPYFLVYCLTFAAYILGLGIYNLVINKFMAGTDRNPVTRMTKELIGQDFKTDLKKWFPHFLIVFAGYYLVSRALKFLYYRQTSSSSYDRNSDDVINYYAESALPYLPLIIIVPFACYLISALLYVCFRDNTDTSGAFKTVWLLTKQHIREVFLGSGAIVIIAFLISGILNRLFYLSFGLLFYNSFNPTVFLVASTIKTAFTFAIIAYANTACILLFGSLEKDKEAEYLTHKINEL